MRRGNVREEKLLWLYFLIDQTISNLKMLIS